MILKVVKNDLVSKIENQTTAGLSHDYIVKIMPTSEITKNGKKVNAVLMEYIEGEDLSESIEKNPEGLEERLALRYSNQLLEAISYMIDKGYEHRDLHLDNIRIASDNNRVKVIDFGTCWEIKDENEYDEKYNRLYGGSNDVFSWALLTYKMFTGNHLLSNGNRSAGTELYKNRIKKEKEELRDDNGCLKQEYIDRIKDTLSNYEELQAPIIMALDNKNDLTHSGLVSIVEEDMKIGIETRKIEKLKDKFDDFNERDREMIKMYRKMEV